MMKNTLLLILALGIYSCSSTECCLPVDQDNLLLGEWRLSKLCFSDGASSCNEEDMWDADFSEIVNFYADGSFSFDKDGDVCSGQFEYDGEMDIDLTATDGTNCNFDNTIFWVTRLTESEMIMSPRCIEGCPHLYVRM